TGVQTCALPIFAGGGSDVVLNGVTGSVGLEPTLAALRAGSRLALANKESLVVGGALVRAARQHPDQIVPVDSEHSAMAQALRSGTHAERSEERRVGEEGDGGREEDSEKGTARRNINRT